MVFVCVAALLISLYIYDGINKVFLIFPTLVFLGLIIRCACNMGFTYTVMNFRKHLHAYSVKDLFHAFILKFW